MDHHLLTREVAEEIAVVFGDQFVLPDTVRIDLAGSSERLFPGWRDDVLVVAIENQGVCAWGVSLGGADDGRVVVGGDLHAGTTTVIYCDDVDAFIASRRWDTACMNGVPLLQAQAAELDDSSLVFLSRRFVEGPSTAGWPCPVNLRFEGEGLRILLWSCRGQCDWWISGSDDAVRRALPELTRLSNLATTLAATSNGDRSSDLHAFSTNPPSRRRGQGGDLTR